VSATAARRGLYRLQSSSLYLARSLALPALFGLLIAIEVSARGRWSELGLKLGLAVAIGAIIAGNEWLIARWRLRKGLSQRAA